MFQVLIMFLMFRHSNIDKANNNKMKPVVPQPFGGPDPDPVPVTAVPGRLRGLSGQFVTGVGDGDGGVGGVRGAGVRGKGGPDPETEATSPGRLRGLSGKCAEVDGDGGERWTVVQRRRQKTDDVAGDDSVTRGDVLQFVQDTNKLCRQKRGGFAPGPKLRVQSEGCFLCSSGLAVCLGNSCKGKKKEQEATRSSPPLVRPVPTSSSLIPGLVLSADR